MPLTMLNRKLVRDVWAMRGQSVAVAFVVAAGIAIYVMYQANFASLRDTQADYYARQRFGDVFASLRYGSFQRYWPRYCACTPCAAPRNTTTGHILLSANIPSRAIFVVFVMWNRDAS